MAIILDIVTVLQYLFTTFVLLRILEYIIRLPHIGEVHRKHVLVTGCDGGFGRLLAQRLDKLGFRVFAGVATDEGDRQIQEGASVRLRPIRLDVRDPESVKKSLKQVRANLAANGLWAVVNCASTAGEGGYAEWLQRDNYQECWETNVLGLTDVINTFLPMVKRVKGRIINTASVAGRIGFTGGAAYSMSMHAVEAFSDSLRKQMQPFGVKVVILEPGLYKMNLQGSARRNLWQTYRAAPEDVQQEYGDEFVRRLLRADVDETLDMLISTNTEAVLDAYEHALTAVLPRKRYSVGKEAKYALIPLSYAPSFVQDFVMSLNRPVPAAAKRQAEEKEGNKEGNEVGECTDSLPTDASDNVADTIKQLQNHIGGNDTMATENSMATVPESMTTGVSIATSVESKTNDSDSVKTEDKPTTAPKAKAENTQMNDSDMQDSI